MRLLAIDGNSIANRAFYGIKLLSNKKGAFTNAILGFMNIYLKAVSEVQPDAVAVAFDIHAPTFRHKKVTNYKANRKGMPVELQEQMPKIKALLSALGIKIVELEGYEADDILGTLSHLCAQNGDDCVILSGDRDSLQLVNQHVTVRLATTKETLIFTPKKFREVYALEPLQLIDLKALMGDSSDNISGVAGVGEKTATALVTRFGSVEELYKNLDSEDIKPPVRAKLTAGEVDAFQSKWLATIVLDVPIEGLDAYVLGEGDEGAVAEILTDLEMFSLLEKLRARPKTTVGEVTAAVEIASMLPRAELTAEKLFIIIEENLPIVYIYRNNMLKLLSGGTVFYTDSINLILEFLGSDVEKRTFAAKPSYRLCFEQEIALKNLVFDAELAAYLLSSVASENSVGRVCAEWRIAFSDGEDGDISALPAICERLSTEISATDMNKLLIDIELPLTEVLASMEHVGIEIDVDGVSAFGTRLKGDLLGLESQIYFMAGHDFNISSPKQLGVVLFEEMGLPAKKKNKSGFSTNADVLENLRDKHPIIELILQYRQLSKLNSTYVEGILKVVGADGRIHSAFKQTETRTGRISSIEPNMQNIPVRTELGRNIRRFFVAKEGYVLLDADYSQIELRILAAICGDKNMSEAFLNGEDIHASTAAHVFKMPLEMVTDSMRRAAKAVNFGIVYGIGAFSLSQDIGVSRAEADRYIKEYLANYPNVGIFMEETIAGGIKNGFVTTLFGRRRYIPELSSTNKILQSFGKRAAMNAPIQGSAADVIKIAMVRVFRRLAEEKLNAKLILQVHDELIVEASEADSARAAAILQQEMERAVTLSVPLTAEVKKGRTWYDAKG